VAGHALSEGKDSEPGHTVGVRQAYNQAVEVTIPVAVAIAVSILCGGVAFAAVQPADEDGSQCVCVGPSTAASAQHAGQAVCEPRGRHQACGQPGTTREEFGPREINVLGR
jgi:hypothetical protein